MILSCPKGCTFSVDTKEDPTATEIVHVDKNTHRIVRKEKK